MIHWIVTIVSRVWWNSSEQHDKLILYSKNLSNILPLPWWTRSALSGWWSQSLPSFRIALDLLPSAHSNISNCSTSKAFTSVDCLKLSLKLRTLLYESLTLWTARLDRSLHKVRAHWITHLVILLVPCCMDSQSRYLLRVCWLRINEWMNEGMTMDSMSKGMERNA